MKHRALVADDEDAIRFVLRGLLEDRGFEVVEAADGEAAVAALGGDDALLLGFVDVLMPALDGLAVLDRAREAGSPRFVVVMTAQDTMRNAVEALRRGAFDYVTKPFDLDEIDVIVERAVSTFRMKREVERLRERVRGPYLPESAIVGRSAPMQQIFKTIGRVAASEVTTLIEGESGTGKELIARAIHFNGTRASEPFVVVNAAAIPSELLESEIFGHQRGAFTGAANPRPGRFEEADGGTLFLDEIGEMPLALQAKLLRVLEDGTVHRLGGGDPRAVDVRVVAATNRDLRGAVREGRFRHDLFYRLNVVRIEVPALRERIEDLPNLVDHFVAVIGQQVGRAVVGVSEEVLERMRAHAWPGNVRELENAIRRAIVLGGGPLLRLDDFPDLAPAASGAAPAADAGLPRQIAELIAAAGSSPRGLYERALDLLERPLLEQVLARTGFNQVRAAEWLGINRNTLRKKIRRLGIEPSAPGDGGAER